MTVKINRYQAFFNRIALQQVLRPAYIPDVRLGIGFAQVTQSIPLPVILKAPANTRARVPSIQTLDQAALDGKGIKVNPSDFPSLGYMGPQIGGF